MLKNFHETAGNDFEAASQVLTAGLDVEASSLCFKSLESKVLAGEFDVRYIDRAVKRVLRAKFELGLFEDPYLEKNFISLAVTCQRVCFTFTSDC